MASLKRLVSTASKRELEFTVPVKLSEPSNPKVPPVPVLEPKDFSCPKELNDAISKAIDECAVKLAAGASMQLGYPTNHDATLDYAPLQKLEKFKINNVGDPEIETNNKCHTHDFELGVLAWLAKLWDMEDPAERWGYISSGGTESNLQGIYAGREVLPDGILYTSADSHFSVFKAARLLRMETIVLDTNGQGVIDYDQLREQLASNKSHPAILSLNIGTTMWGGIDDPETVIQILSEEGYTQDRFYIHLDGALSSIMLPFLEGAPKVSFKLPIGSVSMSGHKFLGVPYPCGVIMIRRKYLDLLATNIEYVFMKDVTFTCSRSGHAAVNLWFLLSNLGYDGVRRDVLRTVAMAQELRDMLMEAGIKAWVNDYSITVVFERPHDDEFIREWQLACLKDVSHIVVMPHLTREVLKVFVDEYSKLRKQREGVESSQKVKSKLLTKLVGMRKMSYSMRVLDMPADSETKKAMQMLRSMSLVREEACVLSNCPGAPL